MTSLEELGAAEHAAADTERWPFSARSLLVLGERGSGKTTFIRSLHSSLQLPSGNQPASRPLVASGGFVEVRSLDRTDRVLTVLVERLRQLAVVELGDKEADKNWSKIRRYLVRSDGLYSRFIAANAVTEAELITYLQRRENGTDETRAALNHAVRDLRLQLMARPAFRGHGRPPTIVFFLDDLDVLGRHAWEAFADIDRYMCLPGLAFVFSGMERTMELAIRQGLAADRLGKLDHPVDTAILRQEGDDLFRKYFPISERIRLRTLGPVERLGFESEGTTLGDRLATRLDPERADLFLSSLPVERPHAGRLPGKPRDLNSLCTMLDRLPEPVDFGGSLLAIRQVLEHSALAATAVGPWWSGICRWVNARGPWDEHADDRKSEPKERVADRILQGVASLLVSKDPPQIWRVDYGARPLGGPLPPLFNQFPELLDGVEPDEASGWVELFIDVALSLDPWTTFDVLDLLGLRQLFNSYTYLPVPEGLHDAVERSELRDFYFRPGAEHPSAAYHHGNLYLAWLLDFPSRRLTPPLLPPTTRGLLEYLQAQQGNAELGNLPARRGAAPEDLEELRIQWQLVEVSHIKACLAVAGLTRQPVAASIEHLVPSPVVRNQRYSPKLVKVADNCVRALRDPETADAWTEAWAAWMRS